MNVRRKIWVFPILLLIVALLLGGCSPRQSITTTTTTTSALTPLEKSLASGIPTLAEFGRGTCIPCKEMEPILKGLAIEYKGRLNVEIVSVDTYRALTNRYGIMAIPTQIFFDSSGKEVTRHIGFYPKEEIITELKKMGIE